MVNLTSICMKYMPVWLRRPETKSVYFRRQALYRLTGTFYGLSRNTWRNALRKWHKKSQYRMEYRQIRNQNIKDLHGQRLLAAIEEKGMKMEYFMSTLTKSNIELNRKILSQLAIYEPRTFESLVELAKTSMHENAEPGQLLNKNVKPGENTFLRGMIKF